MRPVSSARRVRFALRMVLTRYAAGSYPLKYEPGPRIIDISFPVLPTGARRAQQLAENGAYFSSVELETVLICSTDAFLAGIVDRLSSDKYTVIYVTSPREDAERDNFVYQSEQNGFEESRHIELKRNLRDNSQEDGPKGSQSVFEKYQFLSSGKIPFHLVHCPVANNWQAFLWASLPLSSVWEFCMLGFPHFSVWKCRMPHMRRTHLLEHRRSSSSRIIRLYSTQSAGHNKIHKEMRHDSNRTTMKLARCNCQLVQQHQIHLPLSSPVRILEQ